MDWRIRSIHRETEDTRTYVLSSQDEKPVPYVAGQFLTVLLTVHGRPIRRSYSFSSSPLVDEWPSITVKRVPNGEVSRFIHDTWNVGDAVETLPPVGKFTLGESVGTGRDIFLLAAGSGIAPVFSLMQQALLTEKQSIVHLLYSNRNEVTTIFYHRILDWQARYPDRLKVEFFFSESKYLDRARLTKYVLEDRVSRNIHFPMERAVFFLCGPHEYMQMAGIELRAMGVPSDNIRREVFVVDIVKQPAWQLADKTPKNVSVRFQGNTFTLTVPHNKSILDVALENKIELPYSCRAGRCSACAARCVQGKVAMSYNEVLTSKDEADGTVLTCTGHPLTDDVIVVFP